MRFLVLTQYYRPEVGAAQVRLHNVARALKNLGHDVHVITAMPNYPQGEVFQDYKGKIYLKEVVDDVPVERTWIFPVREAGFRRLLSYGSFQLSSLGVLGRATRRWKPDFIFVESPPLFLGLSAMLFRWRTSYIFNVADLWPDWAVDMGVIRKESIYYKVVRWLEHHIYKQSSFITIVVQDIKPALLAKNVPEKKILFLPNGVDLELFSPTPRALKSSLAQEILEKYGDKKIVLYAGTHGKYHGLEVAIDAAEILKERRDILFLFVGDGAEKQNLQAYAHKKGVGIVFRDPVPHEVIAELFQLTTVALSVIQIPTRAAKVFPAMASAKPIVYAGVGEGAELVREAGAALVVSPRDSAAIAEAICKLVDDTSLASKLGDKGRQYVEQNLDWPVLVENWLTELTARQS